MEKKLFFYADKDEQFKRSNRFLILTNALFYTFVALIVITSALSGVRSLGYTAFLLSIVILMLALSLIVYFKNNKSTKLKHVTSIGLIMVTFLVAFAFDNYYIRFLATIPIIANIISFDKKFSAVIGIATSLLNIGITCLKIFVLKAFIGNEAIDNWGATFAICMLLFVIYLCAHVLKEFNEDTMGKLESEKQTQQIMLNDVIHIAEEVREGTAKAMDIVADLNNSTEVVSTSMKDIAESTQSTAENIQVQTVMTNSIQTSIDQTVERSEDMLQVANESKGLNINNLELMISLKEHSTAIFNINLNVAESMKKLQEKMNAVRSVTDTIFSISNQTNLLALNASIESARAGEAGKGFAVVADEIRKLAEKTKLETDSIEKILSDLITEAEQVATTIDNSVSASQTQDELIIKVSDSIQSVNGNVNKLNLDIENIDKMLVNLSESNNQIVENIMQLSATTEEVTATSAHAEELSIKTLNNAEHAKNVLNKVLTVSYQLDKYIVNSNT